MHLVHNNHDRMRATVGRDKEVAASMFNLGFLPGSASKLTTQGDSTVCALMQLETLTMKGGVISVHCYLGQKGGLEESNAVNSWMSNLPWDSWRVARYEFCNKVNNKEILFLAQKL